MTDSLAQTRRKWTIIPTNITYLMSSYQYVECSPVQIKVGHLVEVQVSFSVVPISKGRHLMLSKLRSVCILDQVVQKVRLTVASQEICIDGWLGSQ